MTNKNKQPPVWKRGFSVREAAHYCGVSVEFFNQARSKGEVNGVKGPNFSKIGKKVIYTKESLDNWIDSFAQASSIASLQIINLEAKHKDSEL